MTRQCAAIWLTGTYGDNSGERDRMNEQCERDATHTHNGKPCCWLHFMAANGPRAGTENCVRFVETP